ncbi:MAG: NADH-quinone oxidoreductase subunit N, partial [Chloroflexi bacterium]|nr:NADH-quinone oxidoreductase subunit N [Chloroflexota bacterium]
MTLSDLYTILPLIALVVWACLLLLADLFIKRKGLTALLAAAGLALSMGLALAQAGTEATAFTGMVTLDGFSTFLDVLFLASGLLGVAVAYGYLKRMGLERGEFYTLLLFSITGMMLMAHAADLIVVFLALELLSIPLYVLAAFARPRADSEEAGLKYFLLGAFATGFVVYGITLVFGATGTTSLAGIASGLARLAGTGGLLLTIGAALILVGFGFKVAAVPFHMWTPDVYQGAPTPVTAFMSVGAKAAGFAALLRVFTLAFPSLAADLTPVLWALAALTMFAGNVIAIAQTNIKRMLAYSSIAHAGYILMALVAYGNPAVAADAVASALFYLVAYAVTSFGAWSAVMSLEKQNGVGLEINDFAGLGRRKPLLAAAMTIFMLSFTGMPPTLGLVGKFYLFRTAVEGGFIGLAVIGA